MTFLLYKRENPKIGFSLSNIILFHIKESVYETENHSIRSSLHQFPVYSFFKLQIVFHFLLFLFYCIKTGAYLSGTPQDQIFAFYQPNIAMAIAITPIATASILVMR